MSKLVYNIIIGFYILLVTGFGIYFYWDSYIREEKKYGAIYEYIIPNKRDIVFREKVNIDNSLVRLEWYLWYDGEISANGLSDWMQDYKVADFKLKLKDWANRKIELISKLKIQP